MRAALWRHLASISHCCKVLSAALSPLELQFLKVLVAYELAGSFRYYSIVWKRATDREEKGLKFLDVYIHYFSKHSPFWYLQLYMRITQLLANVRRQPSCRAQTTRYPVGQTSWHLLGPIEKCWEWRLFYLKISFFLSTRHWRTLQGEQLSKDSANRTEQYKQNKFEARS